MLASQEGLCPMELVIRSLIPLMISENNARSTYINRRHEIYLSL